LADGSEYSGQYGVSQETLQAFHAERMALLAAAKPDLFAAETIPCMEEAKAIVEVLKAHPSYSAWMSFSAKDGNHISSGETIGECAKWLDQEPQIVAIGINCTPPQYITSLIEHIRMETEKPIIVYPNSGEHYDAVSKTWRWEQGACPYAESAVDWVKAGARIIGGCCRTGPEDIMAIVRMLNAIE
jgi:homocysteine S-methyltransferase